jgi:DUF438 domain-containing protein
MKTDWAKEINVAITVSDHEGNIIDMNDKSAEVFSRYGGHALIGRKLNDCHSERSVDIMNEIIRSKSTNVYTIEKNGVKKLIYQCPWYKNGEYAGLLELSMVIPENLPHFIR